MAITHFFGQYLIK